MSAGPASRRGFLRGLATLPLIGGGVALIGQPTAAAVPVTDALLDRYLTWLAHEHRAAARERNVRAALAMWKLGPTTYEPTAAAFAARMAREFNPSLYWSPETPGVGAIVAAAKPSTRAAVVLAAAGVPIGGGA